MWKNKIITRLLVDHQVVTPIAQNLKRFGEVRPAVFLIAASAKVIVSGAAVAVVTQDQQDAANEKEVESSPAGSLHG